MNWSSLADIGIWPVLDVDTSTVATMGNFNLSSRAMPYTPDKSPVDTMSIAPPHAYEMRRTDATI